MKDANKISFVAQLDSYYQRKISESSVAVQVWFQFLEPLSDELGYRLLEAILFNYQFLPSPKQAQDLLPELLSLDFEGEIKQAIAAYHSNDRQAQQKIPPQIMEAIRATGGINKFLNATERQYGELAQKYSVYRLNQESNHANSRRVLPSGSSQERTKGAIPLNPAA